MDTKAIGNITELEVQTYITKKGYQVSIPYGDRARYDQIWDINGKLLRVQIKTATVADDKSCINIRCSSSNRQGGVNKNRRYTAAEIDGVASIYNNKCYYIPVDKLPSREIRLRFTAPKNSQIDNVKFAWDYEVEHQLNI